MKDERSLPCMVAGRRGPAPAPGNLQIFQILHQQSQISQLWTAQSARSTSHLSRSKPEPISSLSPWAASSFICINWIYCTEQGCLRGSPKLSAFSELWIPLWFKKSLEEGGLYSDRKSNTVPSRIRVSASTEIGPDGTSHPMFAEPREEVQTDVFVLVGCSETL